MNRHLLGNIDLVLRLHSGMKVDRTGVGLPSLYRHPGVFPKSLSDAVAFSRMERRVKIGKRQED